MVVNEPKLKEGKGKKKRRKAEKLNENSKCKKLTHFINAR